MTKSAPRRGRGGTPRSAQASDAGEPLVPVVGIGASAGGVEAASELLRCLAPDTGMAFVFIQHLDPEHPSFLPDVLARATRMPVAQAKNGARIEADHVYVIPPNTELSLAGATLRLAPRPVRRGRPALPIDSFLRSLAEDRTSSALGVVLSGTASDGTEGLRAIQENDGITFVQDPRTAKFAGMPQSAIAAGVADRVLSAPDLARELVRLSRHPHVAPRGCGARSDDGDESLRDQIRAVVRDVVGLDFKEYKPASFERRLGRRMALRIARSRTRREPPAAGLVRPQVRFCCSSQPSWGRHVEAGSPRRLLPSQRHVHRLDRHGLRIARSRTRSAVCPSYPHPAPLPAGTTRPRSRPTPRRREVVLRSRVGPSQADAPQDRAQPAAAAGPGWFASRRSSQDQ